MFLGRWVDSCMQSKIIQIWITLIIFNGCTKDSHYQNSGNEEIITFKKDIDNVKTAVRQTNDGGYIIAGGRGGQAWLLKLDKYGTEEWQNTYSLSDFGYNRSVVQTSNGGYLYASFDGIVKVDSNGNEEWKNEKHSFF